MLLINIPTRLLSVGHKIQINKKNKKEDLTIVDKYARLGGWWTFLDEKGNFRECQVYSFGDSKTSDDEYYGEGFDGEYPFSQ